MATAGKVIKCKAAVAWEADSPLVIEEVEVAPPQKNEIRLKVIAASICLSDVYHMYKGKPKDGFPVVMGHEGAGIVESVGPGVTEFKPGDKVIPLYLSQCRDCKFCKNPKTNMCEKDWSGNQMFKQSPSEIRFTCRSKPLLQFMRTGIFSEYTIKNKIALVKVHDDAQLDRVFLFGCGVSTGYGAAINNAKVEPGSVCAVFGLGAVGLSAVMGCKHAGASRIIAVDINEERFEKAKILGATDFVNPKLHQKPISEVLIEMTNGGVDYSVECVGQVDVMRSALESCIKGWGVSVIAGWTDLYDFSARPIQLIAGRTWKGTSFGGFKGKDDVPKLVLDHMAGRINLDVFVTHNMNLDQINEAIKMMMAGGCIRPVISVSK
ncbi:alcohol dehydrogenase 1 [Astyanax mexicanus]|uniref:alcohol dehydrogenase 1 n=1 Tax=Astyanax mexicanus TaxID=7994 RepID=UPI0020CB4A9B|nr:alcohol dehydrogenase 1 [Astyanax mexicanus]